MTDELCDIIPISNARYQELLDSQRKLDALEAAGYDEAMRDYLGDSE